MSIEQITVRQWQENYRAGVYRSKDVEIQRAAGWTRWNCRSDVLAGRLKKIAPVVMKLEGPLILDGYTLQLINRGVWRKALYDCVQFRPLDGNWNDAKCFQVHLCSPEGSDKWTLYTKRFDCGTPEFGCDDVREMANYIGKMARELERDVRPAFLDEKAAVAEYVLKRHPAGTYWALRQEEKHLYSFHDLREHGRKKTIYAAAILEDALPGFQAEGAVYINGFYVSCPMDDEKAVDVPQKGKKCSKKKKTEVER